MNAEEKKQKGEFTILHRVLASSVGGALTTAVTTPLDVVKTRLQSSNQFTGTLDGFAKIIKHEGIGSLWRGLTPSMALTVPTAAIYFCQYDKIREQLEKSKLNVISSSAPALAGAISRTTTGAIVAPLEFLRTYMQSTGGSDSRGKGRLNLNLIQVTRMVVKQEGLGGLWVGLGPTLLRDVPFSAIYWFSYEYLKKKLEVVFPADTHIQLFWRAFISGSVAGAVAASLTVPFDVIKTRRQMFVEGASSGGVGGSCVKVGAGAAVGAVGDSHNSNTNRSCTTTSSSTTNTTKAVKRVSTKQIIRQIMQQEGMRGFWSGIIPRAAKVAPACAIMISSYEWVKFYFANEGGRGGGGGRGRGRGEKEAVELEAAEAVSELS